MNSKFITTIINVCIVAMLLLVTTVVDAQAGLKFFNTDINYCDREPLVHDAWVPLGTFKTLLTDAGDWVGFTRAVLAVQISDSNTRDNGVRVQCSINNRNLTRWEWEKVEQGRRTFLIYDLEPFVLTGAKAIYPYLNVYCRFFSSLGKSISNVGVSAVDLVGNYIYTNSQNTITISTPNNNNNGSNIDNLLRPTLPNISPVMSKGAKAVNSSVEDFTIKNVDISPKLEKAEGGWWTGNVNFLVQNPEKTLPVLTVATSDTLITSTRNAFQCWKNSLDLIDFDVRVGQYWVTRDLWTTAGQQYYIYCKFRTQDPTTTFFISISDNNNKSCVDTYQCNGTFDHAGKPNPHGNCLHIKY